MVLYIIVDALAGRSPDGGALQRERWESACGFMAHHGTYVFYITISQCISYVCTPCDPKTMENQGFGHFKTKLFNKNISKRFLKCRFSMPMSHGALYNPGCALHALSGEHVDSW